MKTEVTQGGGLFRQAISGLKHHRWGWYALWVLLSLSIATIFAGFLSPYDPSEQSRAKSYHPPVKIHITDEEGMHWPFIYNYTMADPIFKKYAPDTTRRYPIKFFVRGSEYHLFGLIPCDIHLFGVGNPARVFLLGSDIHGRDLLSRLLYGARISLSISLVGVFLSFVLGLVMGGISGYFGGHVDNLLMRFGEIIMSIPGIYLLLTLRAIFPTSLSSVEIYFLIVVVLSFIGWAGLSRVIRGMVLSIKEMEFVQAAKSIGSGHMRIILRDIIPNTFSHAIIALTLAVPGFILSESALSFLGLGIQEPDPSWGNMLTAAQSVRVLTTAPWILIPGLFISLTIICFNFLGDGLRDALDPRFREQ
jgi:peptide/nickel transport system permease protein